MSRPAVSKIGRLCGSLAAVFVAAMSIAIAAPRSPHMERAIVPEGCRACHAGHGESRSPMLPAPQSEICLGCHETPMVGGPSAALLTRHGGFRQPYRHPVSDVAYSAREPRQVVCTSCHSPHRGMPAGRSDGAPSGRKYMSPKSSDRFEYELCYDCHGGDSAGFQSSDLGRDFNPANRSYHPVEMPARSASESVRSNLSGRFVNCTDCHGNSEPGGLRGPHGSAVRYILRKQYVTTDGALESSGAYELCFLCHERETVLGGDLFPLHRSHVVDDRASCATCHDAHGSPRNRALIRFGGTELLSGVLPSSSGRLEFRSEAPGQGTCYLTCHGVNHDPEVYGGAPVLKMLGRRRILNQSSGRLLRSR